MNKNGSSAGVTIRILTDINPISVHENGASVVDAGIIIEKKGL
ncbi:MAG: acetate--CoA ligase family protein [Proteobacteria bacterium]|nr:acetate--CoA ligase family protein [Pseudomonadota bacterium]